ncbi:hypothetical protein D9619_010075 [Psilocybe cf. subviscida]|uniref:Uncharacterized protein n=1 Tax=Psilocybe cf. subviscida TaxID=2480587 RepID=A0A8H5F668_9AGAR|nr:hypothetical protein D9619_010075 [Psilocybe cf. subviscida]
MSQPWPPGIIKAFFNANQPDPTTSERSAFNGPYNALLFHLFSLSSSYMVAPPHHVPEAVQDASEDSTPFVIELDHRPVFLLDVNPASYINIHSNRKQADARMRHYFAKFREQAVTPYLYGASAFGSRLRFYKYTLAANMLEPAAIQPDPVVLNDLAPTTEWDCDLLDVDGAARFREVVDSVLQMCRALEREG